MPNKFRVNIIRGSWHDPWPKYFERFYNHCGTIAMDNNWNQETVINYQLKELGGRLIKTSTQGWYLRWDKESSHTAFVLKWS